MSRSLMKKMTKVEDKTEVLYTPHRYQRKVHIEINNGLSTFITVVSGRQGGKTKLAEMQVVFWGLSHSDKLIWVVSPTDKQCKRIFRNIIKEYNRVSLLSKETIVSKKTNSVGNISIDLYNGTRIEFVSASAADNLRGPSVDFLLLDEGAFIPSEVIEDIILPTLVASKSKVKVLVTTTPKGNNWVKEWFDLGSKDHPNYDKDYSSFRWKSTDSPYTDKELLAALKRKYSAKQYRQEFEAEFVDAAGVFSNVKVSKASTLNSECYVGIDIGIVNDATVIHVLDNEGKTKYVERIVGQNPSVIRMRVQDIFRQYRVRRGYIETNNQGIAIYRDLCEEGLYDTLQPWTTSNSSKEEIIGALVSALDQDLTTIIDDPIEAIQEYYEFSYEFTKTGKLKYAAGRGHDDCVMAHAIAWKAFQDFGPSKSSFNPSNFIVMGL